MQPPAREFGESGAVEQRNFAALPLSPVATTLEPLPKIPLGGEGDIS